MKRSSQSLAIPIGLALLGARLAAWDALPPRDTPGVAASSLSIAQVPENIQVSRDGTTPGARRRVTDFSELHLAVNPTDPLHLLGSSKFFHTPASYGFFTGVFESFDGGFIWAQEQPAGVEAYSLTSDPVNAFDHLGNGYFTLLTRTPTGLDMLKKPKGGSWQTPVVVDRTTVTDKQWIAADQDPKDESPHAGNLYMSWTDVGGSNARIVFARSIDANRSWRPVVAIDSGDVQGSVPVVQPDGTVVVVWGRGIFGGPSAGALEVAASRNGGATFGATTKAADITTIPFFLPNGLEDRNFRSPGSLPAFAASPVNGFLFLVWADYRNGDADIYFARATDGAGSWSAPARLNDDPIGNGVDQFQPQVAVAPNGRVSVSWSDRRIRCPDASWIADDNVGDENFCITPFMVRSRDHGETWEPNIQVGAAPWDWSLNLPIAGRDNSGYGTGFIGDYQGLAATDAFDYPFWPATNDLGDNPRHHQQVWVAHVDADRVYEVPTPVATDTPSPTPDGGTAPTPSPSATAATGTSSTPTATGTPPTPTPTVPGTPVTPTATASGTPATPTRTATPGTTTPTGSSTPSSPTPTVSATPTQTNGSPSPTAIGTVGAPPAPAFLPSLFR